MEHFKYSPPPAELHTPDELLANATAMYESDDIKLFRPAILEAITALESFVQRTVFDSLAGKLDPRLVKWLDEKTRMDFDSRLAILTPVATGLPIDRGSTLWNGYKVAKEIRNKVVHSGRRVSKADVSMVIQVVRDWLSYLGSNVELEAVLLDLKHWVENQSALSISTSREVETLVAKYFERSRVTGHSRDVDLGGLRADLILDYGSRNVIVETKFVSQKRHFKKMLQRAIAQVDRAREATNTRLGCIVVFAKGLDRNEHKQVKRLEGGSIISVVIHLG
ncbi:MAG TPA: hypothetical protein PKY38_12070 [Opitutaceae bacterium]|nr:hypothetical protein [Candidatus Hydrogenedentota bacterium]HRJ48090.1 hypothetical protein [Opitutaceae bacterium]